MNYAIMVMLGDDWQYMCEGPIEDLRVALMTLEDAEEAVEAWKHYGSEQDIKIVEYNP
jgi:hypothetical protein